MTDSKDLNWQRAVKERDGNICKKCGKYFEYIDAHHKEPKSQAPDKRYVVENGISLCRICHRWVHDHPKEACKRGLLKLRKYEYFIDL